MSNLTQPSARTDPIQVKLFAVMIWQANAGQSSCKDRKANYSGKWLDTDNVFPVIQQIIAMKFSARLLSDHVIYIELWNL